MANDVTIVEVSRVGGAILVTFSDGRVTALYPDDIYAQSVEVAPIHNELD
jgi:hypothetical protein